MTDQTRRILVTGGAGFIGSHTCVELLNEGYKVIILDNFSNSSIESVRRVNALTGKLVSLHAVDLSRADQVFEESGPFDAVIHFAGLKAVGESVKNPILYYENNVKGTIDLLRAMEKHKCFNLIFSSSATVYGDAGSVAVSETAPLQSTNPYGHTKLFIEDMLRNLGDPWKITLLRYFNPVGAHESGQIGEDPNGIPNNLMPYITQVAVGRRPHLTIFGDNYCTKDGTGVRDYVHVVDLAKGHVTALSSSISDRVGPFCDAYNLGTGVGYSVLEVLNAMRDATGKPIPHKVAPRRAGDVATTFANVDKAYQELGWKAELGLSRMCEDAWRWQSMNPNGYDTE